MTIRMVRPNKPTINAIDVGSSAIIASGVGLATFHVLDIDAAAVVGVVVNTAALFTAYYRRVAAHWQHQAALPSRVRSAENEVQRIKHQMAAQPLRVAVLDRSAETDANNVVTIPAAFRPKLTDIATALIVDDKPVSRRGLSGALSQRSATDFVTFAHDNGLAENNRLTARGKSLLTKFSPQTATAQPVNQAGAVGSHSTALAVGEFVDVGAGE